MLILVRETGRYGWMIWFAKVMKVIYRSVDQVDGEYTIVFTVKMREYNAVSLFIVKIVHKWDISFFNSMEGNKRYNLINLHLFFVITHSLEQQKYRMHYTFVDYFWQKHSKNVYFFYRFHVDEHSFVWNYR